MVLIVTGCANVMNLRALLRGNISSFHSDKENGEKIDFFLDMPLKKTMLCPSVGAQLQNAHIIPPYT